MSDGLVPIPTQDPFGRGPLVVTSLQSPSTGTAIHGRFSLGWIGALTREQVDLVGLLLARRNNLQQLAADLGLSYNTVRARFDEIVDAVAGAAPTLPRPRVDRRDVLTRLAAGEIDADEAEAQLRGR